MRTLRRLDGSGLSSLDMIVEDTLHALLRQARAAGRTWAEIGELLHVSRQAEFQRFGGGRNPTADQGVTAPVNGAVEAAVPVLQAFLDGRFDDARARFGERTLDACSVELMTDLRQKVREYGGEVQALGTSPIQWDRDVMASLLATNVQLVATVLR